MPPSTSKANLESILKGKNKSKASPAIQEHMSHQYRVWQEKLVSALRVATSPDGEQYVLLHSATLVGLFTCIFVRQSEKLNVRKLSATEVKTGLGGLHGNKVPLPSLLRVPLYLPFCVGCIGSPFHHRRFLPLFRKLSSRSRTIPYHSPQQ